MRTDCLMLIWSFDMRTRGIAYADKENCAQMVARVFMDLLEDSRDRDLSGV